MDHNGVFSELCELVTVTSALVLCDGLRLCHKPFERVFDVKDRTLLRISDWAWA